MDFACFAWGKYYNYRIQAYHPLTGHIEMMESPDPCARNEVVSKQMARANEVIYQNMYRFYSPVSSI